MANIYQWCSMQGSNQDFTTPFNFEGRTMACDGHVLISMPQKDEHRDIYESLKENISTLLNIEGFSFSKLSNDIQLPRTTSCTTCKGTKKVSLTKCKECEGEGEVSFETDYSDYDVCCKSCDGDGSVTKVGTGGVCDNCKGFGDAFEKWETVEVSGVTVFAKYARLLMSVGDDVEISAQENKLYFRSGDIKGLIMGHRKGYEDNKI